MSTADSREDVELPELPKGKYDFWDDYYDGLTLSPAPEDRYEQRGLFDEDQMRDYARAAVLAERERCAKICAESHFAKVATTYDWTKQIGSELAAAIRKGQ